MPADTTGTRIMLPLWLRTELAGQAAELGVSTAVYAARLLEDAAGLRDMPFAWRHVQQTRREGQLRPVDRPSRGLDSNS